MWYVNRLLGGIIEFVVRIILIFWFDFGCLVVVCYVLIFGRLWFLGIGGRGGGV